MRHSRTLASIVLSCGLGACAARPPEAPPPVHVPPPPPAYRAEIASLAQQVRVPFFGPDGRVYAPYGEHVLVADPGDLAHGEIVPFRGALYPRAGRLFGVVPAGEESPPSGARFVELDWRLEEVRHLALPDANARIALTPSGAFATVVAYAPKGGAAPVRALAGLFRTSDFSLVVSGVEQAPQVPGRLGTLASSADERFIVSRNQVLDTKETKVVFSHPSLGASTVLLEGGRLHWLFRDLLETVELGSGKRSQTWLPCPGASQADTRRATMYTTCAAGLVRTTFASGVPSSALLPYPSALEVTGLRVEASGRVVLSKASADGAGAPALALPPGGGALEPAGAVAEKAERPYVEAGRVGQLCRVLLGDGRPAPVRPVSCEASVSPNGRFLVVPTFGGVETFSLPEGKPVGSIGASRALGFNGTIEVDDGELVATRSGAEREASQRVRLRPSENAESAKSAVRVRMVPVAPDKVVDPLVDHDSVVLEAADGKPIAQFPFEPFYTGKARLAGGEIVVYSQSPGVAFAQPHHCKRDGHCEPVLPDGTVLAFAGAEALGARNGEGASAFVRLDLRTGAEVAVPMPKPVTSATAVNDGWVVGLSGGALAHVSRATGAVDHVSRGAVASGLPVVGALGDRVVLAEYGPDVLLVDSATFAVTDHYVLGRRGYLHVDGAGRYSTTGEAAELESLVMCGDGRHLVPREACRRVGAPR